MQNDLKYGKLSEMCGINGYFAENHRKKIGAKEIHNEFLRGGKRIQLLVRIYSPAPIVFV